MKTVKQKLLSIFDTYGDERSFKEIHADLNRRGKIDQKKVVEVLFLLAEEMDEIKSK